MAYIYYFNKFFDNVYLAMGLVFFIFLLINCFIVKWYLSKSSMAFIWLLIPIAAYGFSFFVGDWFALITLSVETLVEFMIMIYFYFLRENANVKMIFKKEKSESDKVKCD